MKSNNYYRFSLGWGIDTEEQILVGELLNKLGNKKSRFIIQLVADYIQNNPDVIDKDSTIKFVVNSNSKQLEDIIKELIKAEIAGGRLPAPHKPEIKQNNDNNEINIASDTDNSGIADMLANLDIWDA